MKPRHPPISLEQRLADCWPPGRWRDVTLLAAVSGGADSVAMLRALAAIKQGGAGRLVVAHYNHRLRGSDADDDARFVSTLSHACGLSLVTGAADEPLASEDAARQARYRFLSSAADEVGARYVVTAHTADDQVETILHRIIRGTGISGLAGIRRTRRLGAATLIRPMLGIRRHEVLEYLGSLGQAFRQDATNDQCRFTRNRIRHELLPLLSGQYNPRIDEALLRLGMLAGDAQSMVDRATAELYDLAVRRENAESIEIDVAILAGQPAHLVRELLVAVWRHERWPLGTMGYGEWNALAEMILAPNDTPEKRTLPCGLMAQREPARMRLTRRATNDG